MDIDADAWDSVHPLWRYPVENGDCFLHTRYILMVLSEIVELPALRHCKGYNRPFFLLCLFCGFLLHGGTFFLKVGFHAQKILPKRPGLALCNGIDVYLNAADFKTVLVKGVEQGIFVFPAPVLHYHIKVRTSPL